MATSSYQLVQDFFHPQYVAWSCQYFPFSALPRLLATEVTYSAALDACARVPQWREALRFVSPKCQGTEMEQLGMLGQCCYTLAFQPCNFETHCSPPAR